MAGLPVFLVGGFTVLTALVTWGAVAGLGEVVTNATPLVIAGGIGFVLVALGLALRGNHAWLVPLAAALTLANAAATVWLFPLWTIPVQALAALVALCGLRGWWWLRQNPA
jgi:hypothetical protein